MALSVAFRETAEVDANTGIAAFVRDRLVCLVRGFGAVDRAVIYGSRARGDFRRYSDIDLALYGEQVSIRDVARIKDAIDDSFIVFSVDVTAVAALAPDSPMRAAIDRDGIVIYDRANPPFAATAR